MSKIDPPLTDTSSELQRSRKMPEWNYTSSFKYFGIELRNRMWSWSGRSADGSTVALALWSDGFNRKKHPITYRVDENTPGDWQDRNGNKERIENLVWSRDHCAGRFRVVMVRAVDPGVEPREVADCFPKENWWMELTWLDQQTGAFESMLIES